MTGHVGGFRRRGWQWKCWCDSITAWTGLSASVCSWAQHTRQTALDGRRHVAVLIGRDVSL